MYTNIYVYIHIYSIIFPTILACCSPFLECCNLCCSLTTLQHTLQCKLQHIRTIQHTIHRILQLVRGVRSNICIFHACLFALWYSILQCVAVCCSVLQCVAAAVYRLLAHNSSSDNSSWLIIVSSWLNCAALGVAKCCCTRRCALCGGRSIMEGDCIVCMQCITVCCSMLQSVRWRMHVSWRSKHQGSILYCTIQ